MKHQGDVVELIRLDCRLGYLHHHHKASLHLWLKALLNNHGTVYDAQHWRSHFLCAGDSSEEEWLSTELHKMGKYRE